VVVSDGRPIGVFDSGVGGLTVARAILDLLPHEPLLYVGDTARFPYGPKPVERIRRYALEIADYLVHRDVKMIVVACNSVEVSAIDDIAARAGIPVVGVVDPGARAAVHATRNGSIGLIGTEATVASGAYDRAVAATGADVRLSSSACPRFVEHIERGDTTSLALREAAREYLSPLVEEGIDTLILGCTHYPLLSGLLQRELGPDVVLVSSAEETAKDVYATLLDRGLQGDDGASPTHEFLATGDPNAFERVAGIFLGPELHEVGAAQAQPVGGGSWS
jgi:glutamate racemase